MTVMNRIYKLMLLFSLLILTSGCAIRIADLTLISTKNIDFDNAVLDIKTGQRVTGSDCGFYFLGAIPTNVPNLETAIDNALDSVGANLLVDQVTSQKSFFALIGSQYCIEVEGTAINTNHRD